MLHTYQLVTQHHIIHPSNCSLQPLGKIRITSRMERRDPGDFRIRLIIPYYVVDFSFWSSLLTWHWSWDGYWYMGVSMVLDAERSSKSSHSLSFPLYLSVLGEVGIEVHGLRLTLVLLSREYVHCLPADASPPNSTTTTTTTVTTTSTSTVTEPAGVHLTPERMV